MPRYRAPTGNREVLAVPDRQAWPGMVKSNRRRLEATDVRIDGEKLADFRAAARREILALADGDASDSPDAPLILTGHQPELFHPGVWVKNFAIAGLARRVGGVAINLIVDNDTVKSTSLRVPTWHDSNPSAVHHQSLFFDAFEAEIPYENRGIADAATFRSFSKRVAAVTESWPFPPLLPRVWDEISAHPSPTLGERFSAARRCWEGRWGVRNRELTVSQLARTEAFRRFARHIFSDLDRFREVYNSTVADYRREHGIRSRNHPVPDLGAGEAPFWGAADASGRRSRATSPENLRPRALTLTLFSRLAVGDFFLHGIGGGKYDEVTDAIIRNYFGVEPPGFAVLSATLHLPLPAFPHTNEDARRLGRELRDRHWNPQRYGQDGVERDRLRDAKSALIQAEPSDPAGRRRWFTELRKVTESLRNFVSDGNLESRLALARREAHANAILQRRDYSWVLFPEEPLRQFLQSFAE